MGEVTLEYQGEGGRRKSVRYYGGITRDWKCEGRKSGQRQVRKEAPGSRIRPCGGRKMERHLGNVGRGSAWGDEK